MGRSSSIRIETAESIMKSNLYTIGLYLKSVPDPDDAIFQLKTVKISELYKRGRKLIDTKFNVAKAIYDMVQKNRLDMLNKSYNSTLSNNGIGMFFRLYNPEYEAHDIPASIDYQLCNPVNDLAGIEFIHKYLLNLYHENEFCMNFTAGNIHRLLNGYDEGYADLLINIFEQVLTAALACSLAGRDIRELNITAKDIQCLYNELCKYDHNTLMLIINQAAGHIYQELNIGKSSLQEYIERSLPRIVMNIEVALRLNTPDKVCIASKNPDSEPVLHFRSGAKMDDDEYRMFLEELNSCRYSSDRLHLIKEKVSSFDDLEDILLDTHLEEDEFILLFNALEDVEIAAMIKRHPYDSDIQTADLSEAEHVLRLYLGNYVRQLPCNRQERILTILKHIADD